MTDPNHAPLQAEALADQGRPEAAASGLSMMNWLRNTRPGQLLTDISMGVAVILPGAGVADLAFNAEPTAAEAAQSPTVLHRHSSLNLQSILNKIRHATMPHDLLIPSDNLHYVHPTSAFLESSYGGFRTDCSKFNYKFFEITTEGIGYKLCFPALPPLKTPHSEVDQYSNVLNRLGDSMLESANFPPGELTHRVSGSRKKLTARYQCPAPAANQDPSTTTTTATGISKIILHRNHTAAVTMC